LSRFPNLPALLASGLTVTLNCDDPAYFGGYLLDNWLACFEALPLTPADAVRLARHSLEASFAPVAQRAGWLAQLEQVAAQGV
jgi:adenosine deaminase